MNVFLYFVERSGSTLMLQILKSIFKDKASRLATHNYYKIANIACYRDFRDIVVSFWRADLSKNKKIDEFYNRKITKDEILSIVNKLSPQMEGLNRLYDLKKNQVLFLPYESFVNNFDYIFDQLERFFHIKISIKKRESIKNKYSLEQNKKICNNLKNWNYENYRSKLRGDHIYKGEVGGWRYLVPIELHSYLTNLLKKYLIKWNYDTEVDIEFNLNFNTSFKLSIQNMIYLEHIAKNNSMSTDQYILKLIDKKINHLIFELINDHMSLVDK